MTSPVFSRSAFLACAVAASVTLFSVSARAADPDLNISPVISMEESIQLAQADAEANGGYEASDPRVSKEKSLFTGKRFHQYLGFGSLAFAIAAAAAAPETEGAVRPSQSRINTHRALGITAAALGGAAIANGFYVHGDDFNLDNGWLDPDNMHVLLAILGTAGYVAALATNGKGAHAAAGASGAALMGLGIALEW